MGSVLNNTFIFVVLFYAKCSGQYTPWDVKLPSIPEVQHSLATTKAVAHLDSLAPSQILALYQAEVVIGKYIMGVPLSHNDNLPSYDFIMFGQRRDTLLVISCLNYVRKNRSGFRAIGDTILGEFSFFEPTSSWLHEIRQMCADCAEGEAIAFDLEFKEFVRSFDIDRNPSPKSCDQYYQDLLKYDRQYRELYTKEEIDQWVPECNKRRAEFVIGKNRLLDKFKRAPFTKILQDLDERSIVIFKHAGC